MLKYVIFEDNQAMQHLRIFDQITSHVDIRNSAPAGWIVVGAGEFHFDIGSMSCVSRAVSLGRSFDANGSIEDSERIRRFYEL